MGEGLALAALDLLDLVERPGHVEREGDTVEGRPTQVEIEALAGVPLLGFPLAVLPLLLLVLSGQHAALLLPALGLEEDREVADLLGAGALGREVGIACQTDRAGAGVTRCSDEEQDTERTQCERANQCEHGHSFRGMRACEDSGTRAFGGRAHPHPVLGSVRARPQRARTQLAIGTGSGSKGGGSGATGTVAELAPRAKGVAGNSSELRRTGPSRDDALCVAARFPQPH